MITLYVCYLNKSRVSRVGVLLMLHSCVGAKKKITKEPRGLQWKRWDYSSDQKGEKKGFATTSPPVFWLRFHPSAASPSSAPLWKFSTSLWWTAAWHEVCMRVGHLWQQATATPPGQTTQPPAESMAWNEPPFCTLSCITTVKNVKKRLRGLTYKCI